MGRRLLLLLVCLAAAPAGAEIYRWVDEDGSVTFSDRPRDGAERVEVPEPSTYTPAPAPPAREPAAATQRDAAPAYTRLAILRPADDDTVRANTGDVKVVLDLEPPLAVDAGHRVQLYLDGAPVGPEVAGRELTLTNVDRGTHTLAAAVLGPGGEPLTRAAPVTFHLLRYSRLHPQPENANLPTIPSNANQPAPGPDLPPLPAPGPQVPAGN